MKALFHCVAEHQDTPVRWDWKTGICELMELDFMTMEQGKTQPIQYLPALMPCTDSTTHSHNLFLGNNSTNTGRFFSGVRPRAEQQR